MTAKDHYENHLAQFYSWMVGNFEEKQSAQLDFFANNNIKPGENRLAIDLGAGNGLQSISLSKLGFDVIAVDFNKQLLSELRSHDRNKSIEIVQDDLMNFLKSLNRKTGVVVCMGDTITHLESFADVEQLFKLVAERLEPDGKLVISFREFNTELQREERFIPVRSDEGRLLTCFLEYFADRVIVYDILHEYKSGAWIQRVSSYPKLRLSGRFLEELMEDNNIKLLVNQKQAGMTYMVGYKSS